MLHNDVIFMCVQERQRDLLREVQKDALVRSLRVGGPGWEARWLLRLSQFWIQCGVKLRAFCSPQPGQPASVSLRVMQEEKQR